MGIINEKPGQFKPGDPLPTSQDLNQLIRAVIRHISGGGGTDIQYYGDRLRVTSDDNFQAPPDVDNYLVKLLVLEELEDYLKCCPCHLPDDGTHWTPLTYNNANGSSGSQFVYVAKPYHLQKSPWDQQTVLERGTSYTYSYTARGVRNAFDGKNTVVEQIDRPYIAGDMIHAVRGIGSMVGPDGIDIGWLDINTAARRWWPRSASEAGGTSVPIVPLPKLTGNTPALVLPPGTMYSLTSTSSSPIFVLQGIAPPAGGQPLQFQIVNLGLNLILLVNMAPAGVLGGRLFLPNLQPIIWNTGETLQFLYNPTLDSGYGAYMITSSAVASVPQQISANTTATIDPAQILTWAMGALAKIVISGGILDLSATTVVGVPSTQINYYRVGQQWYCAGHPRGAGATWSPALPNILIAYPFLATRAGTIDTLSVNVNIGHAGSKIRLGLYTTDSTTNLTPQTLVVDGGEIDCSAGGLKTLTISQALTANTLYWVVMAVNATQGDFYGFSGQSMWPILGHALDAGTPQYGWRVAYTYGALPATFPASPSVITESNAGGLGLRFSA